MANGLPKYATTPLLGFLDAWKLASQLLHLSMRGISLLREMPNLLEAVIEAEDPEHPEETEEYRKRRGEAKEEAELARSQMETGFPLLHAQTLVALWGALEAAIEDLLVGILMNEPNALANSALAKLKIPLVEFDSMEREDRMRYLLAEASRDRGQGRRDGVDHFESILAVFGLTGPINEHVKRDIYEVHKLRNAIVHRGSVADRSFVKACPFLGFNVGDTIVVSNKSLSRYGDALCAYVMTIAARLGPRYNADVSPIVAAGKELEQRIDKHHLPSEPETLSEKTE